MKRYVPYVFIAVVVAALFIGFVLPGSKTGRESAGSETPGDASSGAPIVEVAIPAELSTNATIGKTAFEAKCADCHGLNGAGQDGVAPPLVHKIYEPSHHGDEAFWLAAQRGVRSHHWPFGDMAPVDGLTRADVKMIVTYVRELQRENGIR
jgi:mono/diheme cytochrome c family protein